MRRLNCLIAVTLAGLAIPARANALDARLDQVAMRLTMSKAAAHYVVRHVENARRILANSVREGAPLEPLAASLAPIIEDLHQRVIAPVSRSHSGLSSDSDSRPPAGKVYRATQRDISRSTAAWLVQELLQAQQSISRASANFLEQVSREDFEEKYGPVLNASAEISAATKVVSDAYPKLWEQHTRAATPEQKRTDERDANFRKFAMPKGSVRLTSRAIATIKSFMRQAKTAANKEELIASIGWTSDVRSRGPEDTHWKRHDAGLVLGAYSRSQLPPDVIDRVGGIEIVFTADSRSRLARKTIDFRNDGFVILEE